MQNSTWKLAALAGVVGIGFLVVLQTQRGLSRRDVTLDEQAVPDDQGLDDIEEPHASLGRGDSVSNPQRAETTSTPQSRRSSASEYPAKPKTDGNLASGQFEPQPGEPRSETAPASISASSAADPFAPSAASTNPSHHSATADGSASVKRDSTTPDDKAGLDFRNPGPKSPPATTGTAAKTPDHANPFETVPPAASTVVPAGGTQPVRQPASAKPAASGGHAAPKKDTNPFDKNPFASTPTPNDSKASAVTAGPVLVAPGQAKDSDKSDKTAVVAGSIPSKKSASPPASTNREPTLSPQPTAAFPDAKPPASIASPSPTPDAFNPFEAAPGKPVKDPTAKDSAGTEPSSSAKPKRLAVPAVMQPDESQPKPFASPDKSPAPSPATGKSKTPGLIAPALPSSDAQNKTPAGKPADSSVPGGKSKPTGTKSIRVLDKQPLPPKTPTEPKPSPVASRHGRNSSKSDLSGKSRPPQRLDVPKQVNPLKADSPAGDRTTKKDTSSAPQKAQLKIEKLAPKNAILGQPMIYHILVKNIGGATAHQVVVKDQVPQGVQLTGTMPRAYLTGRSLSWRLGTLKPNETRKIAIRVVPQAAGEIGSIATVDFVSKVAARPTVTAPKLSLTIDAPKTIRLGKSVQFHFKITNSGNSEARGVFVRDIIPPELNHAAGRDLEYKIGTLAAGKTQDIRLTMKAVKSGNAVNRAIVTADGGLNVQRTATVRITDRTDLTITRTGPRKRYVGQTALYTNRVTNHGQRAATGVRLVESVPTGMDVVKTAPGGRFDRKQRTITWTIDRLDAGKSRDLTVTMRSLKAGSQHSSIVVVAADGSRANVQSETVVRGLASLRIEMPPVSEPVDVGNPVALRIVAANRGSAPATNVKITVALSEELTVASARGPVKNKTTAGKIEFESIKSIAPGKELILDVILRSVKPGDARVSVTTRSDQMQRPLIREDAVRVLADDQ